MLKSYLDFELYKTFGVVTSQPSNVLCDPTGTCVITGALERVIVWSLRQGAIKQSLGDNLGNKQKAAIVSRLCLSPDSYTLAVGYSSGIIKLWDIRTSTMVTQFTGHKSEVTALNFNKSGNYLVSGSKDTDVIVWDVLGDQGLFKLRGHKNAITQVLFLENTKALVSSSKDQLIKIWDLETKHCVQVT